MADLRAGASRSGTRVWRGSLEASGRPSCCGSIVLLSARRIRNGLDVSFYVFSLPAIHAVMAFLVTLTVLSFIVSAAAYGSLATSVRRRAVYGLEEGAEAHAGGLLAAGALIIAVNYWLARYDLLLGNNQRFSGATYTDINASKPGLTILAVAVALVAALFILGALRRRWKPAVVDIASTVATALVVTMLYPALVENFKVRPNAAELESLTSSAISTRRATP